jgi:hypothetical protein
MTDRKEIWASWQKAMSEEFIPFELPHSDGFIVPPDTSSRQGARAAEYSAAQLGQINHKLDKLIAALERLAETL